MVFVKISGFSWIIVNLLHIIGVLMAVQAIGTLTLFIGNLFPLEGPPHLDKNIYNHSATTKTVSDPFLEN